MRERRRASKGPRATAAGGRTSSSLGVGEVGGARRAWSSHDHSNLNGLEQGEERRRGSEPGPAVQDHKHADWPARPDA
jgi:hypothetical protein